MHRSTLTCGLLAFTVGCVGDTLPEESLLDRQRILAARFTSDGASEAQPGGFAEVELLAWSPSAAPSVLIALCPPDPQDLTAPCPADPAADEVKSRDMSLPENQAWARQNGILGVHPGMVGPFPVPDLGPGIDQGDGRTYLPLDLLAWSPDQEDERATVTLVVSESAARNLNPGTPTIEVDGERFEPGPLILRAGSTPTLTAVPAEPPERVTDPEDEPVEEIYTWRWYSDVGELAPVGLDVPLGTLENTTNTWTLPDDAAAGVLFLVVRDGRGGVAWASFDVTVQ